MEKPFSVVNFPKEKKVAVVSSNWLVKKKDFCYWPVGPNSTEKLEENLPPEGTWSKFPCLFLKSYSKLFIF
jgi:hypothetical protein